MKSLLEDDVRMLRVFSRPAALALAVALLGAAPAGASLLQISSDPFTNPTSQHATEVEPDVFAFGGTMIAAFQAGRFNSGGASDIGFARSTNGGATWTKGFLPGLTVFDGAGTYARASDPAVAYDARHKVWMVASLGNTSNAGTPAVLVSRSTDGGVRWGSPVTVATSSDEGLDKPWIVCDNTPTSRYYGHCYYTFEDARARSKLETSTSRNGGLTWSPPLMPGNRVHTGLGGQPLVQPNGTVIVPTTVCWCNGRGLLQDYKSTNGGASWTGPLKTVSVTTHPVAGSMRALMLPTAKLDRAGRLYIAWQDCRFRRSCGSNDIVFSTTMDGVNWTPVKRIPIDPVTSTVDHFIPALAVDPRTSGATAHLALTYYFFPKASCTKATCQLKLGYVSSADGGAHWTRPVILAGPIPVTWLAVTGPGFMVGDYSGLTFSRGIPHPVFASALAPRNGHFREGIYTWTGLPAPGNPGTGTPVATGGRR